FGDKVGSRRNDGLDISVPQGTPIKAAENGVVIYAGDGLKEFGNTVLIKHESGLVTVYGHADSISVERGATVKRGQEIATAGMTGDADV
ncbi:M23 family metallopeptidase, partial [Rhodococcus sp. PAE-6]|uniref:M23 family metallopeptidase n=1 Tax=Rhodococcus sp. PAE-6 TaxID=2972477 RepID=UPI0021B3AD62